MSRLHTGNAIMISDERLVYVALLAVQMYVERPRAEPRVVAADAAEIVTLAAVQRRTRLQRDRLDDLAQRYGAHVARVVGQRCALRFSGHGYRDERGGDALQIA